jgi:ADP-heptose:LPS heptosyltransferase
LSGAKETIGFSKNPFSFLFTKKITHKIGKEFKGIHEINRNLELISHLRTDEKFTIKLYPSTKDFAEIEKYTKQDYICIAPASLWYTKQYPKEKWIEFIKAIDESFTIYLLGSKQDISLCDDIINLAGHKNVINLAGKLSMLESAALMKSAKMNYVNDSAPLHLASAMNARTTAVFCSTVTDFGFGPLSDDSVVVETKEQLACRPCGLHGYKECPEKHFKCALSINKEQLLERIWK